jgi:hypothetical protein
MSPSGIEPATLRFVAEYLNHFATINGPPGIPGTHLKIGLDFLISVWATLNRHYLHLLQIFEIREDPSEQLRMPRRRDTRIIRIVLWILQYKDRMQYLSRVVAAADHGPLLWSHEQNVAILIWMHGRRQQIRTLVWNFWQA